MTIALHRVFDCPNDNIVWDVGHQSYVHKLYTGRRELFDTLRSPGGISGFTRRDESEYDVFGAGHSSTSLSAALGLAEAERLSGSGAYTVAVVGDGAFTGGMIHEALNNCEDKQGLKLIVVLNENEMSISKNIGRFATKLAGIRSTPRYFRTKAVTKRFLSKIPLIGKPLKDFTVWIKKKIKNAFFGSNYFEDLGLFYIGPVDGNDEARLEDVLREARECGQNAIVHIKTKKGMGYAPAENMPSGYHSVPPAGSTGKHGFSEAFAGELVSLAENDERFCAITAAMSYGTGLDRFAETFPDRFFDVGIAEDHAVTFAAGLAARGMKPAVAIYSTFLQRAYDSVLHDAAL
ncbi:MAG: 1-deoxy-D-xylulose-5-phosphate synthase [Clostridia bacterium]|nr:1-deoxy-D-xylulose-5-phosphate synthase [Clostridia bacterium]